MAECPVCEVMTCIAQELKFTDEEYRKAVEIFNKTGRIKDVVKYMIDVRGFETVKNAWDKCKAKLLETNRN